MPRYDLRESSYDGPRLVRTVEAQAIDAEQKTETEETLANMRLWAMRLNEGPTKLECKVMAREMLEQAARLGEKTGMR